VRYSIFDMDRTVTRGGSYSPWLLYWAWHEAPWRLALLPLSLAAGAAYLAGLVSRGRLKEINHRLLMGARSDAVRVARRAEAFAGWVVRRAFADARARIAAEQAEGRTVVLATASYEFYVRAIADRLGVEQVVATRAHSDGNPGGAILARIDGENCYGAAKRAMVEAALPPRAGLHVRFFSDHHSDAPMFDWADERFAINPTQRLRLLAATHGWTVLGWS
jgi:HAD superfamily hydrolase (TIGR01490 family)